MTNAISMIPGVCNVTGKTAVERRISALYQGDGATLAALCAAKGAVGKAAREGVSSGGLVSLAHRASKNNYSPIAAYVSAVLGVSFHISNRASFESVPDRLESLIADAKLAKNGGFRVCKKTGAMVPGAKLATLIGLLAEFTEMVQCAEGMRVAVSPANVALEV